MQIMCLAADDLKYKGSLVRSLLDDSNGGGGGGGGEEGGCWGGGDEVSSQDMKPSY